MYQDSFKHMTTFSSGGILLSSAVTGALFPKPDYLFLLIFSIVLFAGGALFALLGLILVTRRADSAIDDSAEPVPVGHLQANLTGSALAAYLGLVLFFLFALQNL